MEVENEKKSTEILIDMLDRVVKGLEQKNYIYDHKNHISLQDKEKKVLKHKPKLRLKTLLKMFT